MKTYQSKSKDTRRNFFARHKYAFAVALSAAVIIAAVVLAIVFTVPDKKAPPANVVDPPNQPVETPPTIVMPMTGATIGMGYADSKLVRWPTLNLWQWHPAVDFVGSGDVCAIRDGQVTAVEKTTMDGNVVTLTHDDGYVSVYKSLGNDVTVKVGDSVKAGDKIGVTSTTMMSELDAGDHLHFELKHNGKHIDPATVLPIDGDK